MTRKRPVGEAFAEAMKAYEDGRKGAARRLAAQLAESAPSFGGTHYLLGLLAIDQGQERKATEHFARAIGITPGQAVLHLAMADALAACGEIHAATVHYRTVLSLDPAHAEAHARLGELLRQTGKAEEAIGHCRQAVAINPRHAEAHHTLGALLLEADCVEEAAESLRLCLEIRPGWPAALNNFGLALHHLGRDEDAAVVLSGAVDARPGHGGFRANLASVLRCLGRLDEARAEAEQATRVDSGSADAWLELGLVRRAQDHHEGAAAAFDRAVTLAPGNAQNHWCLAESCRALGQLDRAHRHYRLCLDLDPSDRHGAGLGLALAGGAPAPAKAPDAYVRQLFDEYADGFDAALLEHLEYRAPALLAAALVREMGRVDDRVIMDAGCGTGLAGLVLRPLAVRLDGIDLSPAMVAKARARGIYDTLAEGDLVTALVAAPDTYDVVVAADVLVYLGALAPVMNAAHAACTAGGLFAFTVERAEDGIATYALGAKSRYAHAADYVRSAAAEAGFTVLHLDEVVPRREGGVDVPGLLAVLRKA
jgi:predicted TPR repeat methyltransferase